jgi:transposase
MAQAFGGPVEIDESYFGGRRKGKRGRGAAGKVPVFGLLTRGGRVYAQMVGDCRRGTLLPIIRRRVKPQSYSDSLPTYDTLSVEGYRHVRIDHGRELAARGGRHINGIENFWNQPSGTGDASTVCPRRPSTCSSKSASGASTIKTPLSS